MHTSNPPASPDTGASTPTPRGLRIGIIGTVHDHFWPVWGEGLLRELQAQPGVHLVAATETHDELRTRLTQAHGVERLYTDAETMLAHEMLDAVVIGLPSNAKVAPIRAAAARGLHILVDKPLCTHPQDARTIAAIVREAGVQLVVNSQVVWKPAFRAGLALLREGAIGRPLWARWRTANPGSENYGPGASRYFTDWLWDMEQNGGGVLINYCYYGISYLQHLFGRPQGVSAMAAHFVKENIPSEMEDNAMVMLRWPHAFGQAEASWTQFDGGARIEIDPTNKGLIVYGTEGVLRTSHEGYLMLCNAADPRGRRIEVPHTPLPWANGAAHFADVVRGACEVDPLCSLAHNVGVQDVIDAAYRANRERIEVALPPLSL